ncbi:MAG: arylformamidase [Betaproteobacteria bacterium]|jgi:acetyl esterase/lipase|nr:arylformamidase [Betaproteobacteria bacterium]
MTALYRGMDRAALDAAYNNGAAVANSAKIVADWQARSERVRAKYPDGLDLKYGPAPRNRIDFFEAKKDSPLLVFIHGGYWQMRAKELFAFLVPGPLAHGISVALVGYTLAPEKRMDAIVGEIRTAISYLDSRGNRMIVSGWSAGGHLAAMAMQLPCVNAGLAISGLYDLEPIRHCYVNDKLRLDAFEAQRNSPVSLPAFSEPITVAYGKNELPELRRQSEEYAKAVKQAKLLALPNHDHFTILEELASPNGALTREVITLSGL